MSAIEKRRRRSTKAGLPPGVLMHIGEKKAEKMRITVMDYDESSMEERELPSVEACEAYRNGKRVSWINVSGIHDVSIIDSLGSCFGIHPLILEDILNTEQRPKMDDHDDYIFVVLKMIYQDADDGGLLIEQVSIILGRGFILSFQEGEGDVFGAVRERLRAGKGRIRKRGADYLAYALIDAVVDSYFSVLEEFGEDLEDLQEELVRSPEPETLETINYLKRDMIYLRKSVWPLREIIGRLERGGSALVDETTGIYLRDVYDHTVQVIDNIESYRDMLSGMLDIYLSSISNRMNEVMKVLTIIATIFIPVTFIAGVYGMNFEYMPELKWRAGYFLALGAMAGVAAVMLVYFRRKRWL